MGRGSSLPAAAQALGRLSAASVETAVPIVSGHRATGQIEVGPVSADLTPDVLGVLPRGVGSPGVSLLPRLLPGVSIPAPGL
jgi:hypothetical protein